jgi:hypothetical protein
MNDFVVNPKVMKRLLRALIYSNNSTKRSLQHLEKVKSETEDPQKLSGLKNGINNKKRTITGNENILRMYLEPEELEKLGITNA